jgi:hypothetical protein
MKFTYAIISFAVLALSNCASIVGKSTYDVAINNPNKATTFKVLDNADHTLAQGTTSTTASLKSSSGFFQPASYRVVSYSNSKQVATQALDGTINPWIFGNIFNLTGIIGFAIDGATGAMYKLPETVNIYTH